MIFKQGERHAGAYWIDDGIEPGGLSLAETRWQTGAGHGRCRRGRWRLDGRSAREALTSALVFLFAAKVCFFSL